MSRCPYGPTRRGFLAGAGGLAALAATTSAARTTVEAPGAVEPFWGVHQAGIVTPQQAHSYVAALDVTTTKREDIVAMLRTWTAAAARMTSAGPAAPIGKDESDLAADSGDALGLPPARLTLTFGFGAGLFVKDGRDRYGLAARRPEALVDLPRFNGDQLVAARTGGDLSVQACAEDPQVAFHAVRQLARLAYGAAQIRWAQTGFLPQVPSSETPRNLMGFKDGTSNPSTSEAAEMQKHVWVGTEGPDWMRGGTYVVLRRIRIALEHWDRTPVDFQEETIGRRKHSGAPVGGKGEFDPLDLDATDAEGNPVIAENAHVRLAAAASNDGARILRRGYSYNDGVSFTAERWPPWRQSVEYDAGLLFACYQRDPRTGFIKLFEPMSKLDMLNQFVTHTGGGLFACPGGAREGEYVGQRLFEAD
jgi:deferrochelatase/peroxidase EfeB